MSVTGTHLDKKDLCFSGLSTDPGKGKVSSLTWMPSFEMLW